MTSLELKWLLTALLGGAGCGLAGFILVSMNLPFMGICLAHAALAGAVLSYFIHTPTLPTALVAALLTAALIGPLADKTRTHANTMMSILFSLTLGLAFLGIGLLQQQRSDVLSLMWGNLLLVRWVDLWPLGAAALLPLLLLSLLGKETKAVLFDREIARSSGIHATAIYYAMIAFCGLTVTVNLNVVGGLMLYSLLTNPAVAAFQLSSGYRSVIVLSMLLGTLSALGGLVVSFVLNWPAGASIVLVSSLVYAISLTVAGLRSAPPWNREGPEP